MTSQHEAALWVCERDPAVVLIDLALTRGSPLAVADFCSYRRPEARIVLLGGGGLMADGSLFGHVGNAAVLLSGPVDPTDLASILAFQAKERADHVAA
ncbi:hypothetical protein [Jannaschia marina]|uniref:hypothetical protein n=1 Tax=Jannaschia marina TaxID=2741674 RepID=UPI0015CE0C41|nr:hypothetical protein [Jannaschia marina]